MVESEVIETDLGRIRGIKTISALATPYTAFLGVPYAKPPLGDLRFKVSIDYRFSVRFQQCNMLVWCVYFRCDKMTRGQGLLILSKVLLSTKN